MESRLDTGLIIGHAYSVTDCRMVSVSHHSLNRALCCNDVIMSAMSSEITRLTIVYSTFYLGADQRKHQMETFSVSLAFVSCIIKTNKYDGWFS